MKETVKFNTDDWKIKIVERSKGRMKIQIKLSREESQAFKNFTETVKPEEASFDDFAKSVFLMGIEYMNIKLSSMMKDYAEAHRDELASSGVDVDSLLDCEDPDVEIIE